MIFSAESIARLPLVIAALLPALTFHEWGHAMMATRYGDNTPRHAGRLTLNPFAHLDLMGTIVLIVTQFIGWAKPVPINPANFKGSWGSFWVASAGPLMNLVLATVFAILYRLEVYRLFGTEYSGIVSNIFAISVLMNLGLAFFNLIPIGPLDGSHMLQRLLPLRQSISFASWNLQYGGTILFVVIMLDGFLKIGVIQTIIQHPIAIALHFLMGPAFIL